MTQADETLLLTIKARLERAEDGKIIWLEDKDGPWSILQRPSESKVYQHFIPAYQEGFDKFGNPIDNSKD